MSWVGGKKSKPPVSCRVMSSWVEEKEGQKEKTSGLTVRRVPRPLAPYGGRDCGHMSCRVVPGRPAGLQLCRVVGTRAARPAGGRRGTTWVRARAVFIMSCWSCRRYLPSWCHLCASAPSSSCHVGRVVGARATVGAVPLLRVTAGCGRSGSCRCRCAARARAPNGPWSGWIRPHNCRRAWGRTRARAAVPPGAGAPSSSA